MRIDHTQIVVDSGLQVVEERNSIFVLADLEIASVSVEAVRKSAAYSDHFEAVTEPMKVAALKQTVVKRTTHDEVEMVAEAAVVEVVE